MNQLATRQFQLLGALLRQLFGPNENNVLNGKGRSE